MGVLKHGRLSAAIGAAVFLLAMFAILGPLRPVELLQDDKSTQYCFGPVFRPRKIPVIPADSGPLSRLAARTVADTLAEALPDILDYLLSKGYKICLLYTSDAADEL